MDSILVNLNELSNFGGYLATPFQMGGDGLSRANLAHSGKGGIQEEGSQGVAFIRMCTDAEWLVVIHQSRVTGRELPCRRDGTRPGGVRASWIGQTRVRRYR